MSSSALQARYAALQSGIQASAPPNDPVVLTSVLTTDLATKAAQSDLTSLAAATFDAVNRKVDRVHLAILG